MQKIVDPREIITLFARQGIYCCNCGRQLKKGIENMPAACRAFSSDQEVNSFFNLIPHCVAFGEAGAAAALSIDQGVSVRNVDFASLRKRLIAQNVPLPCVYPPKYKKGAQEPVTVYAPPILGASSAKAYGIAGVIRYAQPRRALFHILLGCFPWLGKGSWRRDMTVTWARCDKFFGWKALATGWMRDTAGSYKSAWELAIIILAIGLVSPSAARGRNQISGIGGGRALSAFSFQRLAPKQKRKSA